MTPVHELELPPSATWHDEATPAAPPRGRRAGRALAVPGLLAVAAGVAMGAVNGGFEPTVWYPVGIFLLALLALVAVVAPPGPAERGTLWSWALAAFAGFTLWSFLSISWAASPGDAWEGANRTLLYLLVLTVVGLRPWSWRAATLALGLVGFGVAALAAAVLVATALGAPEGYFLENRLASPTGYTNATASLWLIALWPALHLTVSRRLPWPVRGAALAAACLLLQVSLLSQSRGALLGLLVAAAVFVIVVPRRIPALLSLGLLAALAALSWTPLAAVNKAAEGSLDSAMAEARSAILVSVLTAFLAGAAAALAGRRMPRGRLRPSRRAGNWALAGTVIAVGIAGLAAVGDPGRWVDDRWQDFKGSGYDQVEQSANRYGGSLGSNRYDFWRVALNEFRDHPVRGIGVDNFAVPYLQQRRSPEAPRHPHSLAFQLLSQVGLVGTLLFVAFLAFALTAVARMLRRAGSTERGIAAAGLAGFVVFAAHGLADWLWAFPALGTLAFAMLALAVRTGSGDTVDDGPPEPIEDPFTGARPVASWGARALPAAATLLAAISLALPGVAARYTSAAYENYNDDPAQTLTRLDRSARLNFLSSDPLVAKGVIAGRLGQPEVAHAAFEAGLRREPDDWFARFELGLLDAQAGRSQQALSNIAAAARLNPRQPVVRDVAARALRGEQIDPLQVERELFGQLQRKVGSTERR